MSKFEVTRVAIAGCYKEDLIQIYYHLFQWIVDVEELFVSF